MQSKIVGITAAAFAGSLMASAAWAAVDGVFLQDVIKGSIAEVKMGQLAQQNGGSEEVRKLGTKLVADHSVAMDQASALAKSMNIPVPDQPSPQAEQDYQQMQILTGATFDKAFVENMVEDHEKDIQKFEEQARAGSDQVAQFAKATLPTLQTHLDLAQSIAKQQK